MKIFNYIEGELPILISIPHNGARIPPQVAAKMRPAALTSVDSDWHLDRLYQFAGDMGCHFLIPEFSRYVIDLNRSSHDDSLYPGADVPGLCPINQFDYQPIYRDGGEPNVDEIARRVETYWRPYHDKLSETLQSLSSRFGYVLLFEAHSIQSQVPRFFEGVLPDFNFGNFDEKSSSEGLTQLVKDWRPEGYSKVFNQRFKGGYITRHYGEPLKNIDSLQLELSQATYMNESTLEYDNVKAGKVQLQLGSLFQSLAQFVREKTKND
ncbi:N-formylglutamate deformylase [Aliikangiella marina]|uniref:N-formylglutamate deformylase n=1 Tax=Aliikangiella marina TaxID=1712262 RepID=A0A545T2D1_9GAMM|nr:N-formylglutamate deformylase [Aliikangiella marina]TQV71374.1 N-formylglutamate deformylase [Aliikangiella marina]